jgi:hypothetical protein
VAYIHRGRGYPAGILAESSKFRLTLPYLSSQENPAQEKTLDGGDPGNRMMSHITIAECTTKSALVTPCLFKSSFASVASKSVNGGPSNLPLDYKSGSSPRLEVFLLLYVLDSSDQSKLSLHSFCHTSTFYACARSLRPTRGPI